MYVYLYSVFKLIALVHLSCVVDGESSPTFKACGRKGVTQRKAICKVHICNAFIYVDNKRNGN